MNACQILSSFGKLHKTGISSRTLIVFVVLTGISALSTVAVVGFAPPIIVSSISVSPSPCATTTMLQYVGETNYNGGQYHRSRPRDVKVVDVEVEKQEFVYIPLHEMEDVVNEAQENHEQHCASMQSIIDEQREELKRRKEQDQKSNSADREQYDHLVDSIEVNWGENHEAKTTRTMDRVRYLTNENQRMQIELDRERERFEIEKKRLQQKLEAARDETAEAEQVLSVEKSYFETAIKLLEAGLDRETNNVKALEEHLWQYNQMEYYVDHHQPFHDDLPPFETWEDSGAYKQQQENHHHEFHKHMNPHGEAFEDFQPQVRPQEVAPHYSQDPHFYSEHEGLFRAHAPQNYYLRDDDRINNQSMYARPDLNSRTKNPAKATTTVMGASSIKDNLGINDIRDVLHS